MKQKIVTVNGKAYDPLTGLPLSISPIESQSKKTTRATQQRGVATAGIHHTPQKSATLSRRYVKRTPPKPLATRPKRSMAIDIMPSSAVKKFAEQPSGRPVDVFTPAQPHTASSPNKPAAKVYPRLIDRPAETHPVMHRAQQKAAAAPKPAVSQQRRLQKTAPIKRAATQLTAAPAATAHTAATPKPAVVLKNEAIAAAMAKEVAPQKARRVKKQRRGVGRWLSMASAGLAVMLLGAYFTYLSMPNISIRVAALQSGVNATYPGYQPNGYALRGPISFKQGEVSMKFAYADGSAEYSLTQIKSDWDSAAVKQHVIATAGTPTTTSVDGLTLFTAGNAVTWVNGGILYRIESQAPLSGEQIRKIATSL